MNPPKQIDIMDKLTNLAASRMFVNADRASSKSVQEVDALLMRACKEYFGIDLPRVDPEELRKLVTETLPRIRTRQIILQAREQYTGILKIVTRFLPPLHVKTDEPSSFDLHDGIFLKNPNVLKGVYYTLNLDWSKDVCDILSDTVYVKL
ncbi:hypothetical protein CYMTET_40942 [Cymbomonas tetramitiformis]|uniref:Uncharacterized protein n=1 Tax=Cymbomonas tetramitiformis TaxID=36881 RepID=A0AAE0C775_9CHLO|nr:hypothetical protein CYMTET_40942 [Cymbomonas tetramitiformis]